jgi:hypothetical protein
LATPPAAPVTSLKIEASHILDASGGGKDEANIIISVPYKAGYLPVAYFTTSPDGLTYTRMLLSGLPPSSPTNSLLVSDDDIAVERHGNRIAVESKASHTVMWTKLVNGLPAGVTPVTIPAFSFALEKVGGSVHDDTILDLYGYTGASNYIGYEDEMGFNANGALTGPAGWGPINDCFVIMHGITTYVPYVPPT